MFIFVREKYVEQYKENFIKPGQSNNHLNVALVYNIKPTSKKNSTSNNYPQNEKNHTETGTAHFFDNDKYAEWDTEETIFAVRDALAKENNVTLVEANENLFKYFSDFKPDIVFNIAEGMNGITREAQIPAILDYMNIPYTGSDALTLSVCLQKSRAKEILSYHNIPNAKFIVSYKKIDEKNLSLIFPLFVKPDSEGSSKGIYKTSLVNNLNELNAEIERIKNNYNQASLIEEFLPGREFTCAILGNGESAKLLPVVEILHNALPDDFIPVYSYEAKWIFDNKENPLDIFKCPAELDSELENKIKEIALKTYKVLNCKDWSRIDIRLDKHGNPNIIEINPLPGILPDPKDNSCFPKAARTAGINYDDMINAVLKEARMRYGL